MFRFVQVLMMMNELSCWPLGLYRFDALGCLVAVVDLNYVYLYDCL